MDLAAAHLQVAGPGADHRDAVRAGGGAGHDEVVPHGPGGPDAGVLPVEDRPTAVAAPVEQVVLAHEVLHVGVPVRGRAGRDVAGVGEERTFVLLRGLAVHDPDGVGRETVALPVEPSAALRRVPACWFERKLLCTIWPLSPWRNEAEPTWFQNVLPRITELFIFIEMTSGSDATACVAYVWAAEQVGFDEPPAVGELHVRQAEQSRLVLVLVERLDTEDPVQADVGVADAALARGVLGVAGRACTALPGPFLFPQGRQHHRTVPRPGRGGVAEQHEPGLRRSAG